MSTDPRLSIHNVTVQQLPPTQPRPKKRLSHTVKAAPSSRSGGTFTPIHKRAPLRVRLGRFL